MSYLMIFLSGAFIFHTFLDLIVLDKINVSYYKFNVYKHMCVYYWDKDSFWSSLWSESWEIIFFFMPYDPVL